MINVFRDGNERDDSLEQIHLTAVRILSEIGVNIGSKKMRERLAGIKCKVSGNRVYIPSDVVEKTIKAIPERFKLYGRGSDSVVLIDTAGPSLGTNTGIMPNIYDLDSCIIRRSIRKDVELTTLVLDALSEIDVVYVSLVDATDVPSHMITLIDFLETIKNTTKPMVGPGAVNRREAKTIIEMALALRNGNRQELIKKPPCAPFVCAITPLNFPEDTVDALEEIALAGLPLLALTNPVMGATAPYTIAGTVALGHAEELAIEIMAHAVRPGLPIISFNTPTVADMRTMASTTGGPETGMLRSLVVKLSNYLGIPSWGHGHTSSTKVDEQASDEKTINAMMIANARPSLLGGLGGLANVTLTSYETLVMDNERFCAFKRILKGIAVDEDHLAYSVISDLVKGQNVISHEHTIKYLRGNEVWNPRLVHRQGLINGKPEDKSMKERAREEVKNILQNHKIKPLARDIEVELDDILNEFHEKHIRQ